MNGEDGAQRDKLKELRKRKLTDVASVKVGTASVTVDLGCFKFHLNAIIIGRSRRRYFDDKVDKVGYH